MNRNVIINQVNSEKKEKSKIKVGITIEGSDGLTWSTWKKLANIVESCGFEGLYRSDHYTSNTPPDKDSLEMWVSLTWLADNSKSIEFGPLVTPFSFRHPTMTARMASAVDDLSNGRLLLGLGAGGWHREHQMFGLDLLEIPERLWKFREGTEIVKLLLSSNEPINYNGEFYNLKDAILLPRPQRPCGPPILIGGNGRKYTLPIAAEFADEWNGVYLTIAKFTQLNSWLDELLDSQGREYTSVVRSMLTGCIFGKNKIEVKNRFETLVPKNLPPELRDAVIVGNGSSIVDQISCLAEVGLEKIMLVWYDLNDFHGLELLASEIFRTSE